MKWTDGTSYSQSDKEKIPAVWNAKAGSLRLTVHKHIYYDKDQWLLSGLGIFDKHLLHNKDVDLAKQEALDIAKQALKSAIDALE